MFVPENGAGGIRTHDLEITNLVVPSAFVIGVSRCLLQEVLSIQSEEGHPATSEIESSPLSRGGIRTRWLPMYSRWHLLNDAL